MFCIIIITTCAIYKSGEREEKINLALLFKEPLSLTFIQKYEKLANWSLISEYAQITPELLRHYQHRLDWNVLLKRHILNEELLEEFAAYLNWDIVSRYQILSSCFIREHENLLNLKAVLEYQKNISPQMEIYLNKKINN